MKHKLISFEGGDGAGKSVQVKHLSDRLSELGRKVIASHEPGGTPKAEEIRRFLLSKKAEQISPEAQLMLFAASRMDHLEKLIKPALAADKYVLLDRYVDSSRVYQGVEGGVDMAFVRSIETLTVQHYLPSLTLVIDVPVEIGLSRIHERAARANSPVGADSNLFENVTKDVLELRRQAFLNIAQDEPQRCVIIDSGEDAKTTHAQIWEHVIRRFPELSEAK